MLMISMYERRWDSIKILYRTIKFESNCKKKLNPFTEPDAHNNSYDLELNCDQLLSYNFESEVYFLHDISGILKPDEELTCLNFNIR